METCSRCRGIRVHDPVETPFTMAWNTHGNAASAAIARKARTKKTEDRDAELREVIENAEREGNVTLRQLSSYLNELGIPSACGKRWHGNSVRRVRQRIASTKPTPVQPSTRNAA